MNADEMIELCKKHSMYTWSAGNAVAPIPIERAEGVFMYEPSGKRHYDFNSQLMSVNIGHHHPKVREAMKDQVDKLLCMFSRNRHRGRARLSKKLADLVPGNINTFFYTLGGAEANENALKAARYYTGRHKFSVVIARTTALRIPVCNSPETHDVFPMSPAVRVSSKSWIRGPTTISSATTKKRSLVTIFSILKKSLCTRDTIRLLPCS